MEKDANAKISGKRRLIDLLPSWKHSAMALFCGFVLILSFPDFELSSCAWIAFLPLLTMIASAKTNKINCFILGWIFGTTFFFGTCYWLSFAMIHYGGIPTPFAYLLVFLVTGFVGLFPAVFALGLKQLIVKFGAISILAAPFLWTATEFLRFYLTGNVWNAVGYSQAFSRLCLGLPRYGGVFLVSFVVVSFSAIVAALLTTKFKFLEGSKHKSFWMMILFTLFGPIIVSKSFLRKAEEIDKDSGVSQEIALFYCALVISVTVASLFVGSLMYRSGSSSSDSASTDSKNVSVIAIQPNVPMEGLKYEDYERLRNHHVQLAETELKKQKTENSKLKTIVIFPESPMNYTYAQDREFQQFLREFTRRDNVSVLFNSAEPTENGKSYTNSAVLVNERGDKIAQYDKIFLLPFGEYIPFKDSLPFVDLIPPVVGNFEYGRNYNLVPFGDTKAGIVICFESAFPNLTRIFADEGADVLIEITNDGYLGNTPVLRQHLANAVFRAVETNRPLVRVTNVGISAFIDENGNISDATENFTEDTRTWQIKKSDGAKTFYVKYGDWFAWLCSLVSLALLFGSFKGKTK